MAVLTIHKRLRALGSALRAQQSITAAAGRANSAHVGQTCTYKTGIRAAFFAYTLCSRVRSHRTRETVLSNRNATLGAASDTDLRFQVLRKGLPTSEMQEMGHLCF